jgi:4-hydroxy-tetrahydrodipicolinate synthase
MLMGGHGVISVTANVAPRLMSRMCTAALAGDVIAARDLNRRLIGLHRSLFVEANPIPVKWVLTQMGLIAAGLRLPMTPLSASHYPALTAAMALAGIEAVATAPAALQHA